MADGFCSLRTVLAAGTIIALASVLEPGFPPNVCTAASSPHFRVTMVGAPHHLVQITGINRWGTVVGNFSSNGATNDRSFIYRNGQIASLPPPSAGSLGNDVYGISDAGVVAESPPPPPASSEGGNASQAFAVQPIPTPERSTRLQVPGQNYTVWADAWANSISHNGWIAGGVDGDEPTAPSYGGAILWHQTSSGTWQTNLLARSASFPESTAVDAFGDAVGYTHAGGGQMPITGFFWPRGGGRVLLSGAHAKPLGISAVRTKSGEIDDTIVGSFELNDGNSTPCIWHVVVSGHTKSGFATSTHLRRPLAATAGVGAAEAVNGSGWMTGWLLQDNHQIAALWVNGKVFNLNLLIAAHSAWTLIDATGINNKDQIGATAMLQDGRERAIRLTLAG